MKVGIQSSTLGVRNLQEAFALAEECGAEGVELVCSADEAKALLEPGRAQELRNLSDSHGLTVTGLNLNYLREQASLMDKPPIVSRYQSEIVELLPAAAEMGAEAVLVPFLGKNAIELPDELDRAIDALSELIEPAEQAGIVVALKSSLVFDQLRFLLDSLPHSNHVKVCYDTANALARKTDVATFVRDLGSEAISQVHFSDVHMGEEGTAPEFNVQPGRGDVDFPAVVRALRAIEFDGWVLVAAPPGDDPLANCRGNVKLLKELLAGVD